MPSIQLFFPIPFISPSTTSSPPTPSISTTSATSVSMSASTSSSTLVSTSASRLRCKSAMVDQPAASLRHVGEGRWEHSRSSPTSLLDHALPPFRREIRLTSSPLHVSVCDKCVKKTSHLPQVSCRRATPGSPAIRAVPLRLVSVGRDRSSAVQQIAKEYADKIRRYTAFDDVQVKSNPRNASDARVQVETEGEKVLKAITPQDWVILLDERGREVTSHQFADTLRECAERPCKAVVLCIGGPHGHGPQVAARADDRVRLSRLVLNHDVALLVLLEQIYRAWTILRGEKYHH